MASVKNAAARFNVTPEYVRKLCRTGKICYTAISSRKWLINMDRLAQFFAQGEPVREDSQQVTNGLVLDSDMLLDDLIDRWFEEYANKQLKAKTLYDYRRMRGRISAGLGHLKVSKIKPAHDENEDVQAIHLLSQKKAPPGAQDLRPVGHLAILTRAPRMAGRSLMTHYVTRTYLLSSCGMGASSRSSRLPS